jgi:hypothetical protein
MPQNQTSPTQEQTDRVTAKLQSFYAALAAEEQPILVAMLQRAQDEPEVAGHSSAAPNYGGAPGRSALVSLLTPQLLTSGADWSSAGPNADSPGQPGFTLPKLH